MTIITQTTVTMNLLANGGLVASKDCGYLSLVMTYFHQCLDLVSFFVGKHVYMVLL